LKSTTSGETTYIGFYSDTTTGVEFEIIYEPYEEPTVYHQYPFTPSPNQLLNLEPGESKTISVTLEHLDKTIDGSLYDISFDITGIIGEEGLKKNYLYQVEK